MNFRIGRDKCHAFAERCRNNNTVEGIFVQQGKLLQLPNRGARKALAVYIVTFHPQLNRLFGCMGECELPRLILYLDFPHRSLAERKAIISVHNCLFRCLTQLIRGTNGSKKGAGVQQ